MKLYIAKVTPGKTYAQEQAEYKAWLSETPEDKRQRAIDDATGEIAGIVDPADREYLDYLTRDMNPRETLSMAAAYAEGLEYWETERAAAAAQLGVA